MSIKDSIGRFAVVAAGVGFIVVAASPAFAVESVTNGCEAWTWTSYLYVKDTASDSHSVYANYKKNGSSSTQRLDNNSGAGSTAWKDVGATITSVQGCVNIQLAPDTCGPWGS